MASSSLEIFRRSIPLVATWISSTGILFIVREKNFDSLRETVEPIDEFVTVISGKLILTADGGSPQHFDVGQSVLVPKGFTGTWEMQGNFREMIVIMNQSGGD